MTSSITAEIGVWNWKRRRTSSLTFAIVSCALRASGPSPGPAGGARSATSCTTRHSRRRKRTIPSTPASVHSMSWSAGPMKRMVSRIASAPYSATISSGPSTFPFVFDIFVPPICTQPWWKRRANGSRKPSIPKSFIALTKKRE